MDLLVITIVELAIKKHKQQDLMGQVFKGYKAAQTTLGRMVHNASDVVELCQD